jgi:two-component system phosphate regulon sensor histidine kinase PhoR
LTIRSSIFAKLLVTSALLIGVTLAGADVLLTRYTADRERALVQQRMAQSLQLLAPALTAAHPADLRKWAADTDAAIDARVTVIDNSGVVLADSRHDPETMENHAERPEVRAALAGHPEAAIRRSATLDVDFYYLAVAVDAPDHPHSALRLAVPLTQVAASISAVRALILRASALAGLVALLIAYLAARSFTRGVRRVEAYAAELVREDYTERLALESDDELGSVARSLRTMAEHFRQMMDRLGEESTRREAILGGMVEGVLAVERNLHVVFYNDAFATAIHAPGPAPAPGSLPLQQVVRDTSLHSLLSRVIATEKPERARLTLIQAAGRIFHVQAAPLRGAAGVGAIATLHDITELERLERVRRDFVANISHELRTPLAAIRGYTETLLDGALDDLANNRKFLGIIASHAGRLSDLASDLLTLSEIEAERAPETPERVSAIDLAEEALHAVAQRADERKVLAYLNISDDVYISGQRPRLYRALLNLLMNAVNYNRPGGEVRIDVQRVDGTARISVVDNGIGIASQDIPRIFERFYRVDKARSRDTGGTGLGLSIVKNTVERAGGSITVSSQLGKGSVFTLVFPAA